MAISSAISAVMAFQCFRMATPKTFAADIRNWSDKAQRNMALVMKEATQSVYDDMTERQAGVEETGGSFVVGKVPVDTGVLINSVQISINGGIVGKGANKMPPDIVAGLVGMDFGDTIEAAFTAEYARHVEYGTSSMGGRFFVRQAVADWQGHVDRAAAKFQD